MRTGVLTAIRAMGITLSVDGGNLLAKPKAAITEEARSLIREHKAELLEALSKPALLVEACQGVEGIDAATFRALLSPVDVEDIEGGHIPAHTLNAYAMSFAEGIRTGRIRVLAAETRP